MRTTDAPGLTDPQRVCAFPPSEEWPLGRYDTVLLSNGNALGPGLGGMEWYLPSTAHANHHQGFDLAQIRVVFHPVWSTNVFLAYAERFDIIPQPTCYGSAARGSCPDPVTGMYIMGCSLRSDGTRLGDVVPLSQIRIPSPLVPRYGSRADPKLTAKNSLEYSTEFHLNHFFDKELYYFMLQNDL